MLKPGQIIDARYEVKNKLEEDDHGCVYLGNHKNLQKQIAIKEINGSSLTPEERRQITPLFIEKARTFAKFDHLSIPKVLDFFPEGENFYVIMDYVTGEIIENFMKQRHSAPVQEKEAIKYIIQICKVIWFLHNQRPIPVFLGNLSPTNIIIGYDGNISLVSFGLNRYINQTNFTKPGYTAPEIYRNKPTPLSDIFSLGNILYYMITGLNPAISQHANYGLPPVKSINPDASAGIEQIIRKASDTEPFARFDTIKDMKKALEECLANPDVKIIKEEEIDKKQSGKSKFNSSYIKTPGGFKKNIEDALEVCLDPETKTLEPDITKRFSSGGRDDDEPVYEISSKNLDKDPFEKVAMERAKKAEKLREKQKQAYEAVEKSYKEKELVEKKTLTRFILPAVSVIIIIIFLVIYFASKYLH